MEPANPIGRGAFYGPHRAGGRAKPAKAAESGKNCLSEDKAEKGRIPAADNADISQPPANKEVAGNVSKAVEIIDRLKEKISYGTDFAKNIIKAVSIDPERACDLLKGK